MKKISAVILALAIIFTLSACEEKPNESAETAETTPATEVTTTVPETTAVVTEPPVQIPAEFEERINSVLDFAAEIKMESGCFYDFTKDGFPELIKIMENYADSRTTEYVIYDIKSDKLRYYDMLSASDCENTMPLTLYTNKKTGQYVYVENINSDEIEWISCYQILDAGLAKRDIANYFYENLPDGKLKLRFPASFMDEKILPEGGEYLHTEIDKILGVEDYISEHLVKVEEVPALTPSWQSLDEEGKNKIRAELVDILKDYEEEEIPHYVLPEELKALYHNEEFTEEIAGFAENPIWSLNIRTVNGEQYLILDYCYPMGSNYCSVYNIYTGNKLGEYKAFPFDVYNDNGRERCIANAFNGGSVAGKFNCYEIILKGDKMETVSLFSYEYKPYNYYIGGEKVTEEEYTVAEEYVKSLSYEGEIKTICHAPYYLPPFSEKDMCELIYGLL